MRGMCGVQLKVNKSKDFMLMFDLNETIDQLAIAKQCLLVWSYVEEKRQFSF